MSSKIKTKSFTNSSLMRAIETIRNVDTLIIGAGAGLSLAAGFALSGPRFDKYFSDFKQRFGIYNMYGGGFYPFKDPTVYWAWWSRNIWINRYQPAPHSTYKKLLKLAKRHNYFVITTNVDHQFQLAGFAKERLFYTQGDYGLLQKYNEQKTFNNYELIKKMVISQGFLISSSNKLLPPTNEKVAMHVDQDLAQQAAQFELNLRMDDHFVEDQGWHQAATRFNNFMGQHHKGNVVYLELGVGQNTPMIIKYPFWMWVYKNPSAYYIEVNKKEVKYPMQIKSRTSALRMDINDFLDLIE